MQILVRCWTPEWYEDVTHAILDLDADMVEKFLKQIAVVNKMKSDGVDAMDLNLLAFQYSDYTPGFVNIGDPATIGMSEDDFVILSDTGFHIFPAEMDDHKWDEVSMRPVTLFVNVGDIQWQAYDKHGGAESRCETYSLDENDLKEILDEMHRRG